MRVLIRDLVHAYPAPQGARKVLDVQELCVEARGRLCLVGGSGSGKSTLLSIIAGILVPSGGSVWLDDRELFRASEAERDELRSREIGCVFQTFNLLQGLSALENLTLAQRFAGIAPARARKRGLELLDELGLLERASARPSELSVGEQQRVAIARAISKSPGLVLADEPTASLDDASAEAAADLLLSAAASCTLIVATHDPRLMSRFDSVRALGSASRPARERS